MDRKRKLDVLDPVGGILPGQPGRSVNPFTGRPYSQRYYEILEKRMGKTRTVVFMRHLVEGGQKVEKGDKTCYDVLSDYILAYHVILSIPNEKKCWRDNGQS
jgi:hypothetical protein